MIKCIKVEYMMIQIIKNILKSFESAFKNSMRYLENFWKHEKTINYISAKLINRKIIVYRKNVKQTLAFESCFR